MSAAPRNRPAPRWSSSGASQRKGLRFPGTTRAGISFNHGRSIVKGGLPMQYFPFKHLAAVMALSAGVGCVAALAQTSPYSGLGRPSTKEDIGVLANASGPSGKDLPPGRGTAKQGAQIYMVKCAMCHGRDLEGARGPAASFSPLEGLRLGGGNAVPMWDPPRGDPLLPSWNAHPGRGLLFNRVHPL